MRRLILGLLGATALGAASAANATLILTTPTSVSVSGPTTIDNINYTFGYSDSDTTSPFTETVTWMNDLAGSYGITLSTIAARASGPASPVDGPDSVTDVDITSAFVTGTGIGTPIDLLLQAGSTDQVETYFRDLALGAGTYTLTINGVRGDQGAFGGSVSFEAVPEPATWAMMLLGFGALGWQLRRRRRQVLAQAA